MTFEQRLRDNPMPTKRLSKQGYTIVEINCERNDSTNSGNDWRNND